MFFYSRTFLKLVHRTPCFSIFYHKHFITPRIRRVKIEQGRLDSLVQTKMSKEHIIFSGKKVFLHEDCLGKLFGSESDNGMAVTVNGVSTPLFKEIPEAENGEENTEEIDALLNVRGEFSGTEDSPRQRRVRESLMRLREMVDGGDRMDAVQLIQETVGCVKRLQMDLQTKFRSKKGEISTLFKKEEMNFDDILIKETVQPLFPNDSFLE